MKNKKIVGFTVSTVISASALATFFYLQNNKLIGCEEEFKSEKLPKSFDGFRITQISDLHNKTFGKDQEHLIKLLEVAKPDIIVITGDIIDKRRTNRGEFDAAISLAKRAAKLAPVYFSSGNHEWQSGLYYDLRKYLCEAGIKVLENRATEIYRDGERIVLLGLTDPSSTRPSSVKSPTKREINILQQRLHSLSQPYEKDFRILLSHRPNLINVYAQEKFNLVFSGHAHGGQMRMPLIGALYAPDQGIFPRYTEGLHIVEDTVIAISRGLGNSAFPLRLFNRPELLTVTLHSAQSKSSID